MTNRRTDKLRSPICCIMGACLLLLQLWLTHGRLMTSSTDPPTHSHTYLFF